MAFVSVILLTEFVEVADDGIFVVFPPECVFFRADVPLSEDELSPARVADVSEV